MWEIWSYYAFSHTVKPLFTGVRPKNYINATLHQNLEAHQKGGLQARSIILFLNPPCFHVSLLCSFNSSDSQSQYTPIPPGFEGSDDESGPTAHIENSDEPHSHASSGGNDTHMHGEEKMREEVAKEPEREGSIYGHKDRVMREGDTRLGNEQVMRNLGSASGKIMIPLKDLNESYIPPPESLQSNGYTLTSATPLDNIETPKLQSQPLTRFQSDNTESPLVSAIPKTHALQLFHIILFLSFTLQKGPREVLAATLGQTRPQALICPNLMSNPSLWSIMFLGWVVMLAGLYGPETSLFGWVIMN